MVYGPTEALDRDPCSCAHKKQKHMAASETGCDHKRILCFHKCTIAP